MSTRGIEIQDASGNVYYPHTDASLVRYDNDNNVKQKIDNINTDLNARMKDIFSITSKIEGKKIKILGDSETAGVGGTGYNCDGETIYGNFKVNTSGHCWANEVKKYLENNYSCIVKNFGISGLKSSDIVSNIDSLIKQDDDIILCMIGTNNRNIINGDTILKNDLKTIYDYVISRGKDIIFISGNPVLEYNDKPKYFSMRKVDEIIRDFCSSVGVEYINVYRESIDYVESRNSILELITSDGLHPNDLGHDIVAYIVLKRMGFNKSIQSPMNVYEFNEASDLTQVYYVDQINGSDDNSGLTTSDPLKTLDRALSKIPPNSIQNYTIRIKGDYVLEDNLHLYKNIIHGSLTLTIIGDGSDKSNLTVKGLAIYNSRYSFNNLNITSEIISIGNASCVQFGKCTINSTMKVNTSNIALFDSEFNSPDNKWAINANWGSYIYLSNMVFNGTHGVSAGNGSKLIEVDAVTYNSTNVKTAYPKGGFNTNLLQDTGWVNITLTSSTTTGTIYVRKIGKVVSCNYKLTLPVAVDSLQIATIPEGFKPYSHVEDWRYTNSFSQYGIVFFSGGNIKIKTGNTITGGAYGTVSWMVE